MSGPDKDEIKVATDALRSDGGIWSQAGEIASSLGHEVAALDMSRLEGGLMFADFVVEYQHVCRVVSGALIEGGATMELICQTLREAADQYDREEANNVHLAQKKW